MASSASGLPADISISADMIGIAKGPPNFFADSANGMKPQMASAFTPQLPAMVCAARIKIDDLAFGLLFLSRGRVPVAINKLEVPSLGWNARPRYVANLVRWIGDNSETDLTWQIVSSAAEPATWLDAPVLYLALRDQLPWLKDLKVDVVRISANGRNIHSSAQLGELPMDAKPPARPEIPELDKWKRYLDLGGMLLAVNEGGSHNFAESIEKAGMLMYPQYEWRTLPEDHWAYAIHTPVKSRQPLRGLTNGVARPHSSLTRRRLARHISEG